MKSATRLIAALICAAAGALVLCSKSIAAAPPQLYRVQLVLEEEPAAPAPRCILSLCCWTVLLPEVGPIAHCYTVCTQEGSEAAPRGCRGGPAGLFNNERSQALTYSGCPVSANPSIPAPPANGDPCSSASGTGIWARSLRDAAALRASTLTIAVGSRSAITSWWIAMRVHASSAQWNISIAAASDTNHCFYSAGTTQTPWCSLHCRGAPAF
jgi:hypothetical protein